MMPDGAALVTFALCISRPNSHNLQKAVRKMTEVELRLTGYVQTFFDHVPSPGVRS